MSVSKGLFFLLFLYVLTYGPFLILLDTAKVCLLLLAEINNTDHKCNIPLGNPES